jgi:hypothetical protein
MLGKIAKQPYFLQLCPSYVSVYHLPKMKVCGRLRFD